MFSETAVFSLKFPPTFNLKNHDLIEPNSGSRSSTSLQGPNQDFHVEDVSTLEQKTVMFYIKIKLKTLQERSSRTFEMCLNKSLITQNIKEKIWIFFLRFLWVPLKWML